MEAHLNGNLNQPPTGCSKQDDGLYNTPYYNPSVALSNNASYRIIYLPKAGKIDVKAKEAILITSALLLLGFSLFQFYKKWVKHYRDINQGSFTSYYYKYNSGSLPVMDSPSLKRKDSARVNWNKLGAAISVNARIRAIKTHRQLEDARLSDPLLAGSLKLSSSGKPNSSFRRKSGPATMKSAPANRPTKWGLVRTLVQTDDEKGTNKSVPQRRRNQEGTFDDIDTPSIRISGNSTKDPGYTSNKSIPSCRDRIVTSHVKPLTYRTALQTRRERIKSRSLDDNTEDKHFDRYYQPQNRFNDDESEVFTASNIINKSKGAPKRSSVVNTSNSSSIHNGNITQKVSSCHEDDLDTIVTDYRSKSEVLSHNTPIPNEDIIDEKCKIHYIEETAIPSLDRASPVELKEDDSHKDADKRIRLQATDSWIKLPSIMDASQIV